MQRLEARSRCALIVGAVLALAVGLTHRAAAQLAPVAGAHYAARSSETGFEGAVNSSGGYSASVPLDFSPADPALPIPVSVVYGGKRMGAAGLGWDLPISFVYHDMTAAHRRPESATQGHERWSLSLLGDTVDLVLKNGSPPTPNRIWVAERDHPQLEVREQKNADGLVAYDGDGRTYFFDRRDLTHGDDGTKLANGNLYLLTSVTAPGSHAITLDYAFSHPPLPGGGTGLSIDLNEVFYNYGGSAFNYKDRAILRYNASSTPLAITMLGTTPLVRINTLSTISVLDNPSSKIVRKYTFDYTDQTTHQPKPDPDTGLPRLQAVTVSGRTGTPEASVSLPVASYGYGSIVDPGAKRITFQKTQSVAPPFKFGVDGGVFTFDFGINYTQALASPEPHGPNDVLVDLTTIQALTDLDGDGRLDYFDQTDIVLNKPTTGAGNDLTTPAAFTVTGSSVDLRGLVHSAILNGATKHDRATDTTINDTLRMEIDMNGDGRLDVVETVPSDIDHWIIHLNTPDPSDPRKIRYVDVSVPVTNMRAALDTTGVPGGFGRVPLARNTSVQNLFAHCWFWEGFNGRWQEDVVTACNDIPANFSLTKTITEFELIDVNGDGYPDFVFNGSYVSLTDPVAKPPIPANPVNLQHASTLVSADMVGSRDVKVLINTAGTHLANGVDLFSSTPVTLEVGGSTGCGIARWEPDPGIVATDTSVKVNQRCDFADVNGDGIVDRINATTAALGTGDLANPYSSGAVIALPGPVGRTETALVDIAGGWQTPCMRSTTAQSTDIRRTLGLRDINGDGIADYVSGSLSGGNWTVAMGTGTGFAVPVPVTSDVGLELSLERYYCPSPTSTIPAGISATPTGLFDIDGDGQPEIVTLIGGLSNLSHWDVYQLKRFGSDQIDTGPTASIAEAGRLTSISDGYGASTKIGYKSAKEDTQSLHQVPYPEVVVTAIATVDASNSALVATSRYAYGNVSQHFDASADAFVSTGYQRSVQLAGTVDGAPNAGVASITDRSGSPPVSGSSDTTFSNNLLVGRISRVTTLADANLGSDPWSLLGADVTTDSRRTSGADYVWATRQLPVGVNAPVNAICDNADPYAFVTPGALTAADDMCVKNGFVFLSSKKEWTGSPGNSNAPLQSPNVVSTDTEVASGDVDDLGRVTALQVSTSTPGEEKFARINYASPSDPAARPRRIGLPSERTVKTCDDRAGGTCKTLTHETWLYDNLAGGLVSNGFLFRHAVDRLDENGNGLPNRPDGRFDTNKFDYFYDARGNVIQMFGNRQDFDGTTASENINITYDAFGLVPMTTQVSGANGDGTRTAPQNSSVTRDALTFDVLSATDPNGQQTTSTYDGFGRLRTSGITPTSGPAGVLSATSYQGFAKGEAGPRRITQKVFTDPVANPDTADGRSATTTLDSLGRDEQTTVNLGPSYGGQTMIAGDSTYDLQGRPRFVADLHLSTDASASLYGTNYWYSVDGRASCAIRDRLESTRPSDFQVPTDESIEKYPTCSTTHFGNREVFVDVRRSDSLLSGSSQSGVVYERIYSAAGSEQERVTLNTSGATVVTLEDTLFAHDHLGRTTSMTRYKDPVAGAKVTTTWHYDSLGEVIELDEPAPAAKQFRSYDKWGELIATQWCDPAFGTCASPASAATANRGSFARYDALGRVVHREDRSRDPADGVIKALPQTIADFVYDTGFDSATPPVAATNVIGRLAKASASTSSVSFGYDPYGRTNTQVFSDLTVDPAVVYVEKDAYHGDGSASDLDLLLPDTTNYADEHVAIAYDSAGRANSMVYSDGTTTQSLFAALGGSGIDALGRIRHAQYGMANFDAIYADTGRRLISDVKVSSPAPMSTSREISFAPVAGTSAALNAFNPIGRERVRQESVNGIASAPRLRGYDALGRLSGTSHFSSGTFTQDEGFTYDMLGNLTKRNDAGGGQLKSANLFYCVDDLDRMCNVSYFLGTAVSPVSYDAVGNIVSEPTRLSPIGNQTRTFKYFPGGQIQQITQAGTIATFDYDAFGALQQLSMGARHDKNFGAMIESRNEGGVPTVLRVLPVPGGTATRHGFTNSWTFAFGESRGTRFQTDQSGQFVQDIDYTPFGEVDGCASPKVCTPTPGTVNYADEQWNGGDLLAPFKLVQLGARVYDPLLGRFLSRDPIFDAGNGFNPYAFAANDPINHFDPTGRGNEGNNPGDNPGNNTDGQTAGGIETVIIGGAVVVGLAIADEIGSSLGSLACIFGCSGHSDKPVHVSTTTSGSNAVGSGAHGFPLSAPSTPAPTTFAAARAQADAAAAEAFARNNPGVPPCSGSICEEIYGGGVTSEPTPRRPIVNDLTRAADRVGTRWRTAGPINTVSTDPRVAIPVIVIGSVAIGAVTDGAGAASAEVILDSAASYSPVASASPVVIGNKYSYLFGESASNAHNAARSNQLALEMERLGILDDPLGRLTLEDHFAETVEASGNVIREYSNQYGQFEVRSSGFLGPSGRGVNFESTFQVLPDGRRRLITVIPLR